MQNFQFLTRPHPSPSILRFWLSLSFAFSILYSSLGLRQAFGGANHGQYIVQDDVRQHVFWMWRFVDPELLPDDLLADYFQSVAPQGYSLLYHLAATVGIHPLLFSKLLPPVLDLGITGFCFFLCLRILPVPTVAFASTVLLNQSLWMEGDLASATPRAFLYPLLVAFLYYLLERSPLPCALIILLQGLFYQPLVLISMALLGVRLLRWQDGRVRWSDDRRDYQLAAIGGLVGVVILSPQVLFPSPYGPTIRADEARSWPEFLPEGRSQFFDDNLWFYWLGGDSGLLHRGLTEPATLLTSLFLPVLFRYHPSFPLLSHTTENRRLLHQLLRASVLLFFLAHALLFILYAPNRYTIHTFRLVMALSAAIVFVAGMDGIWRWITTWRITSTVRTLAQGGVLAIVGTAILLYPCFMESFLEAGYFGFDHAAPLYQFLQTQPKDIQIASLAREADNISTFAARSVLVSREHARPYDVGFYHQFRQRVLDVIRAQYSPEPAAIAEVIRQYSIDFWLLDSLSFDLTWVSENPWLNQYQPEIALAIANLETGVMPILQQRQLDCTVFETDNLFLLEANCVVEQSQTIALNPTWTTPSSGF